MRCCHCDRTVKKGWICATVLGHIIDGIICNTCVKKDESDAGFWVKIKPVKVGKKNA